MGAIMDAADYDDTKHDGLSININAPCTNVILPGDHIEVRIHIGGRPSAGRQVNDDGEEASNAAEFHGDTVEILVPKAVRIARQIRAVESSA
jgi:hypothetical protein